jgi:large subunit ribosomal protein L32e
MAENIEYLLKKRKEVSSRRPRFLRQESWRYVRIKDSWRRPKGIDSKMRKQKKGWPAIVKIGYRGPSKVRGLHPTGLAEKIVHNLKELESVIPGKEVARIGSTVGAKKRAEIFKRAKELGIRILNPRRIMVHESKK